jgi:hypothetical protein
MDFSFSLANLDIKNMKKRALGAKNTASGRL